MNRAQIIWANLGPITKVSLSGLALNLIGSAFLLFGVHSWYSQCLSYTGMTVSLLCLIPAYRGMRASKRRADAAGLELMNVLCESTFTMHSPAGDGAVQYCPVCPGAPAWPCSQYLHALAMSNESEKSKLKFLRRNVHIMFGPPEG